MSAETVSDTGAVPSGHRFPVSATGQFARKIGPYLGVLLFVVAAAVLHHLLEDLHHHELARELRALPFWRITLALVFAALSYLALTAGDALALRYVGRVIAYSDVALASFVGSAFNNSLGVGLLSGAAVRFRFYSAAGLSAFDITKVIAFGGVTFLLGLFAVAGGAFLFEPLAVPSLLHVPITSLRPVGTLFLLLVAAYLMWCAIGRKSLHVRGWQFAPPSPRLAMAQLGISCFDWLAAVTVLYVLLFQAGAPSFFAFIGIFMLAQTAGVISNVPGGLGVFESIMLALLTPALPPATVFSALLVFRAVYYVLPLVVAIGLLGAAELPSARVKQALGAFGRWTTMTTPHVLAFTTFVAGAMLLVSGATPTARGRLAWVRDLLPLPVVETSHFLASVAGAALLLLARGLQRRLDAAWLFAAIMLGAGIAFSLLKGFDYEEAAILAIMLLALLHSRARFYRKASLLAQPFTPGWIAAILMVLVGSLWIGAFAHRHAEYSHELWWQFEFREEASRSLRATAGAGLVITLFGLARLLRPATPAPAPFGPAEEARARAIVARSPRTSAQLTLLGDKTLLLNDAGDAFLMYARRGRSWIAMGDPVGPESEAAELAWEFRDLCDRHNGWPVFMEVGPEHLDLYVDMGLALLKLGEEARVPLESFSLETSARKKLRQSHHKMIREGLTFEVIAADGVPPLLPTLRELSDAWLSEKHVQEKGFSMGRFDPGYLRLNPIALVKKGDRVLAFANLWLGAENEELSVDLMRHHPEAPNGVMDYLFIELMLWGRHSGYCWFNLGLAPLSGIDQTTEATPWTRLAGLLYRHGEHFYNFQGLRHYKKKFDPVWEPRYLAAPGGLALPRIIADVASLVAGGVKGLVSK